MKYRGKKECIYLGQTIVANSEHEKQIRKRTGMGLSASGENSTAMKSNLPHSLKRKAYNQGTLAIRNLPPHKIFRESKEARTEELREKQNKTWRDII